MGESVQLEKMRDDIYRQLREKYEENSELLSDGAKALLAMMATTRYMDHYDAVGDMLADIDRRVEAAEKIMDEVDQGSYKGPADPLILIDELVPIGMVEYAEQFTGLRELVRRMRAVSRRSIDHSIHEYEREKGLPLSDLRHPMERWLDNLPEEPVDDLLED